MAIFSLLIFLFTARAYWAAISYELHHFPRTGRFFISHSSGHSATWVWCIAIRYSSLPYSFATLHSDWDEIHKNAGKLDRSTKQQENELERAIVIYAKRYLVCSLKKLQITSNWKDQTRSTNMGYVHILMQKSATVRLYVYVFILKTPYFTTRR